MKKRSEREIQAAVLRAVSRGCRTPEKIAKSAGLEKNDVYIRLTRLRYKGLIKSKAERVGSGRKTYHLNDARVLLFDIWK